MRASPPSGSMGTRNQPSGCRAKMLLWKRRPLSPYLLFLFSSFPAFWKAIWGDLPKPRFLQWPTHYRSCITFPKSQFLAKKRMLNYSLMDSPIRSFHRKIGRASCRERAEVTDLDEG